MPEIDIPSDLPAHVQRAVAEIAAEVPHAGPIGTIEVLVALHRRNLLAGDVVGTCNRSEGAATEDSKITSNERVGAEYIDWQMLPIADARALLAAARGASASARPASPAQPPADWPPQTWGPYIALRAVARWLVSLDEPTMVEARRRTTLVDVIDKARSALAVRKDDPADDPMVVHGSLSLQRDDGHGELHATCKCGVSATFTDGGAAARGAARAWWERHQQEAQPPAELPSPEQVELEAQQYASDAAGYDVSVRDAWRDGYTAAEERWNTAANESARLDVSGIERLRAELAACRDTGIDWKAAYENVVGKAARLGHIERELADCRAAGDALADAADAYMVDPMVTNHDALIDAVRAWRTGRRTPLETPRETHDAP